MKSFIVAQIRSEMLDELLTVLLNAKNMPVDLLTAKINQIAKKQEAAFGKVLAKKSVTLGNFGKLSLKTGK